ncbi:urease accessory protein UreF [Sparassis latifolia]
MNDDEAYILLLLSDSNLPTGSFVASAGLESYVAHGLFASVSQSGDALDITTNFVRDSLATYARSALPFVSDAHRLMEELMHSTWDDVEKGKERLSSALDSVKALDNLYEAMTLNHVARRASKSQGVALLTLYSRGFSKPSMSLSHSREYAGQVGIGATREARPGKFIDALKLKIRREDNHGHLPVCWGVLTAALGLSLERSQFLHLFLHARSLLSASVRLNTLGPYAAQQLLLHVVKPLVEVETSRCKHLRTGYDKPPSVSADSDNLLQEVSLGPAMTWPLGEILAARHDLQHSRIFNS